MLDLAGQAPRAVHLMTPADTFPFASCTSRSMQVDHTVPYDEGGESGVGNYGRMTTTHHRVKTHARWQVKQPFPGIYLWRDPRGAFYCVDPTGTRRIPAAPAGRPRRPKVELWRSPVHLALDYAAET